MPAQNAAVEPLPLDPVVPATPVDPEQLARFVSAQRGAQFTPDGMLKFVLKATAAEEVLRALRTVLEQLASAENTSQTR